MQADGGCWKSVEGARLEVAWKSLAYQLKLNRRSTLADRSMATGRATASVLSKNPPFVSDKSLRSQIVQTENLGTARYITYTL